MLQIAFAEYGNARQTTAPRRHQRKRVAPKNAGTQPDVISRRTKCIALGSARLRNLAPTGDCESGCETTPVVSLALFLLESTIMNASNVMAPRWPCPKCSRLHTRCRELPSLDHGLKAFQCEICGTVWTTRRVGSEPFWVDASSVPSTFVSS
jgi:hypothetical protein